MEKQTTLYFTEKDLKRMELCKEVWEIRTNTDMIKLLLKQEYDRIMKYKGNI